MSVNFISRARLVDRVSNDARYLYGVDDKNRTVAVPFGCAVVGLSEDATAAQNTETLIAAHALNLHVAYPPGRFLVLGGVTLRSGSHIYGQGATLVADPAFGDSTAFYENETTDSYTDTDILIDGLTLDGAGIGQGGATLDRTVGMIRFVKVTGLRLQNVTLKDCGYIGATLRSCKRVTITGCEFTGLGWDQQTDTDGGYALWCSSTAAGEDPEDVIISGCHFHDNYWGGIQLTGINVTVNGCVFKDEFEAHIYTPYDAENQKFIAHRHNIVGNVFDGADLVDLSGNAIETCAWDSVISGNTIINCAERGIQVFSSQNLIIANNTIANCGQLTSSTGRAGIGLITNDGSLGTPGVSPSFRDICKSVQIVHNRFYDDQNTPTMKYGIEIVGAYNIKKAEYCIVSGNDFSDVAWADSGSALSLPQSAWNNETCTFGDNVGAISRIWTPVVSSGTGSITSYNVSQASYQQAGNAVHFTASATIVDNGTGASTLKLSLPPPVPSLPFVCNLWNSTQSRAANGVWSSGSEITFVRGDTGDYPVATGDTVRISGTYLVA